MADVLIVCVREDELQAKALAEMFERAGFTVGGAPANDGALRSTGAGVIVWSQASIRSRPFLDAAQRVIDAEKAVVASLIEPPPPHTIGDAPAFALNGWTGDPEDPALDPLFFAVDRMVNSQRAAVGAAPARPAADPFEAPPTLRPPPPYARPPQRAEAPRKLDLRSPPRAPEPSHRDQLGVEAEHWRTIRDSQNPADFMDYLARYGTNGEFSELAELKLQRLSSAAAAPRGEPPRARRSTAMETPAPRLEPRRADPAPAPRLDPPPPARRATVEPPRRREPPAPAYRDLDRPPLEPTARSSGGGMIRALVLVLLLGGAALGAGLYFGGVGGEAGVLEADNTVEDPYAPGDAPLPTPEELGVGGEETADAPVEYAALNPPAAPRTQQRREPAPAPAAIQQDEAAPPAPQTSWDPARTAALNNGAGGGTPVPLGAAQPPAAQVNPPPAVVQAPPAVSASVTPQAQQQPRPQGAVVWTQRPSARRIADLYPARSLRENTGGRAELDCVVRSDYALSCAVATETPAAGGFGRAALAAAGSYRARPTLSDGASAVGARARISIVFQPLPE